MNGWVSESDFDALDDAVFGRPPGLQARPETGAGSQSAFLEAGFSEEQSERGVRMLESGDYLGFEDVATSLWAIEETPRVSGLRIAEAARRLARTDASTEVVEAGDAPAGAGREPDLDVLDDAIFGRPGEQQP